MYILAVWYDNPVPSRFPAPIDCSLFSIPTQGPAGLPLIQFHNRIDISKGIDAWGPLKFKNVGFE
jgi:hypothetical protein